MAAATPPRAASPPMALPAERTTGAGTALAYTTSRARSYRGRPDAKAPAAGTVYRLHRATCRHAYGPSSHPITFAVWNVLVGLAGPTDDHLLCAVCRPEEDEDPCRR